MTHLNRLTAEDYNDIGNQLDAIRAEVIADLGARDEKYIRKIIKRQRQLEVAGRIGMMLPPTWPLAVAALGTSKILDNMEIGHNVMHGQYDFMNDPVINSRDFDWDSADTAKNWKKTHNFEHHTYTNVINKDHDIGYGLLRVSEEQAWEPRFLANLPLAVILHIFFQDFVAVQSLKLEEVGIYKSKTRAQLAEEFKPVWVKLKKQLGKDYVFFPLLAGPMAPLVFAGNLGANLMRNVWACAVIINGHFPEEVEQFEESVVDNETRGQWYVRQLLGSANFEGGRLLHIMSGNLSFQIEHHLFPDLPAHRYADIAPRVRAICEQYDLPYNTGPFFRQNLSTWKRIAKFSLPGRKKPKAAATKSSNNDSVTVEALAA